MAALLRTKLSLCLHSDAYQRNWRISSAMLTRELPEQCFTA
ncbi:hypothetical protein KKH3_09780 [Pectobacterium actinidiae]|nr:hypothetical protein KKH3_09780 [Pectobacterium actinidiae]